MSLSERIRPNAEAAPWVIEEVKKLEHELSINESFYKLAIRERDIERLLNAGLIDALHQISLASQNSMSSQRECGKIARAAIAKARGEL